MNQKKIERKIRTNTYELEKPLRNGEKSREINITSIWKKNYIERNVEAQSTSAYEESTDDWRNQEKIQSKNYRWLPHRSNWRVCLFSDFPQSDGSYSQLYEYIDSSKVIIYNCRRDIFEPVSYHNRLWADNV
jgi:hypothetical protein